MRSENTSHRKCPPRLLRCVRSATIDLCVLLCIHFDQTYSPIANLFVVESVAKGVPPQNRLAFERSVRPVALISSRSSRQLALYRNHTKIPGKHRMNGPLILHPNAPSEWQGPHIVAEWSDSPVRPSSICIACPVRRRRWCCHCWRMPSVPDRVRKCHTSCLAAMFGRNHSRQMVCQPMTRDRYRRRRQRGLDHRCCQIDRRWRCRWSVSMSSTKMTMKMDVADDGDDANVASRHHRQWLRLFLRIAAAKRRPNRRWIGARRSCQLQRGRH